MWKPSPIQEVIATHLKERMVHVPRPRDNKPTVLVGFTLKGKAIIDSLQTIPSYCGMRAFDVHASTVLVNQQLAEMNAEVAVYYDEWERKFYTTHPSVYL